MEELIPILGIVFVIGVPVMSLAARFVLRPLLQDLTAAVRGGKAEEIEDVKTRLSRLEGQLLEQGQQLEQLVEAELFRRRLEAGSDEARTSGPVLESAAARPSRDG